MILWDSLQLLSFLSWFNFKKHSGNMLWLNPVSLSGRVVDSLAYLGFFFLQDYSFVLRIPWDSFRFFFFFFGGLNGIASGGYESLVVFKDSLWCLGILGDFLFPFCSKGLSVGIIWDFAWTVTSSSILVSILRDSFEISANSLGILPRCCCYLFLSQI